MHLKSARHNLGKILPYRTNKTLRILRHQRTILLHAYNLSIEPACLYYGSLIQMELYRECLNKPTRYVYTFMRTP